MTPDFAAIAAALEAHELAKIPPLPGRKNHLPAGVLLPLRWRESRLELMAILRAKNLREHPGEVAFPGGRPETQDQLELSRTALREAREELGIEGPRLLGRLSAMPLYTSDYRLFPFVAALKDGAQPQPNSPEVEEILLLDVREVLARERLEALPYRLSPSLPEQASPLFFCRGEISQKERLMYGATAHVCLELLSVLAPLFGHALPHLDTSGWIWDAQMLRPRRR